MMQIYNRDGLHIGTIAPLDNVPIDNSDNLVKSGGVYGAIKDTPDKSLLTTATNLIDKSKVIFGTINTTTGNIDASSTYHVTDFIKVDTSQVYLSPYCDRIGCYDNNKTFISMGTASANATYGSGKVTFVQGTEYVRLRIVADGIDNAIFVQAKYYNKNADPQTAYMGFSDEFAKSYPVGFGQYALDDTIHFSTGCNLFDYEHDFYQVSPQRIDDGINRSDGSFIYRYDIITNDEEITGNFCVAMDKYYPVSFGQMIVSNKPFSVVAFYNTEKEFISARYIDNPYPNSGIKAPENAAYARVSFRGNATPTTRDMHSLSEIKDIVIWVTQTIGSNDYFPSVLSPQPYTLIDGRSISPNYLDKVVPGMIDSPFLSAMRCMAIREVNAREHAWRFGNFNMWIMESTKGWNMTKRMLMDYGVDFCGFEECVTNESTSRYKGIAEFLHGWQFPSGFYSNWTDGESSIDKSFVSRFEVIESTKLTLPSASSNASYLNCKVRLPRYMDVYNPVRILSVYVVHFPITQSTEKIAVANDLLDQIATDNSDFIVILGDTNDFGATQETKDYWVTIEAGGFAPVLPYNVKTVTQDNGEGATEQEPDRWWKTRAIDQFFVSDNITSIGYGIKNTKDDYALENGYTSVNTDNEQALSDHDFVYCDLKFDYSKTRTIVPRN